MSLTKGFFAGRPAHYLGHNPAGGWMVGPDIAFALNKMSDDDAAKKWLDAHPDVWKTWMP